MANRYVRAADLGKTASCHVFRHSAATAMLENGADFRFIQEMLGHAKLTSTQVYTRVSITKLKAVHTATHPAATLEGKGGRTGAREVILSLRSHAAHRHPPGALAFPRCAP